ncbi:MAG: chloride channel protein [Deltaproteobacteria bacterium]|nr:chloride channel protein [Candidatus Zymogenaceae bacterium]
MRYLRDKILHWVRLFEQTPHTFVITMAIVIGIFCGLGAAGFRYLTYFFQHLFYGPYQDYLARIIEIPWYYKLGVPVLGGLLLGPIIYFFPNIKGHGVPEVIESVATKGGRLPPWTFILKAVGSAICIGSGGSVGQEGPIVMIGSSIGSNVGQVFRVSRQRIRTFVACGAAGGIAATFNAPIAGVIFAVEIIMGEFAVEHFTPIVFSSVIATSISHWLVGDMPSFIVPAYELKSAFELINYFFLGAVCAVIAVTYTNLLYKVEDYFDELAMPPYLKPALGGLGIGLLVLVYPEVSGVGYETVSSLLSGAHFTLFLLLALIFVKIAATSLSLGSGGSGGIFSPSLVIGATTGGALGYVFGYFFPEMTAPIGAYAVVGMGALVAGTTHGPLTAIIIIFEMTHSFSIIPPLMIACIMSTLVARILQKDSIYTMKLSRQGINIFMGREQNVLRSLLVRDVMRTDYIPVSETASFSQLLTLMSDSTSFNFPVVDKKGNIRGIVSLNDIRRFFKDEDYLKGLIIAKDVAIIDVISTYPDENLGDVMVKFSQLDIEEMPVVESKDSYRIIGIIRRKDVFDTYNRQLVKRELVQGR